MADLTPEGLRGRAWQAMHDADSCDHSSCGVPHNNADRECEAQRIAVAFTTLVAEARRAHYTCPVARYDALVEPKG